MREGEREGEREREKAEEFSEDTSNLSGGYERRIQPRGGALPAEHTTSPITDLCTGLGMRYPSKPLPGARNWDSNLHNWSKATRTLSPPALSLYPPPSSSSSSPSPLPFPAQGCSPPLCLLDDPRSWCHDS